MNDNQYKPGGIDDTIYETQAKYTERRARVAIPEGDLGRALTG